jgi:hypothetical protein
MLSRSLTWSEFEFPQIGTRRFSTGKSLSKVRFKSTLLRTSTHVENGIFEGCPLRYGKIPSNMTDDRPSRCRLEVSSKIWMSHLQKESTGISCKCIHACYAICLAKSVACWLFWQFIHMRGHWDAVIRWGPEYPAQDSRNGPNTWHMYDSAQFFIRPPIP